MLSLLNKGKNLYIKNFPHIVMISGSFGFVSGALIIPPNYYHKKTFPVRLYHHVCVLLLSTCLGVIAGVAFPISIPFALYVYYDERKREQKEKEREERHKRWVEVRKRRQERERQEREKEEIEKEEKEF